MNASTDKVFSARERFTRAALCQPVDRPPVWFMRQAGRALPEYRKFKETYTFVQLVQTPELAAEVTFQPVRRFGFDAAIFFSDFLLIPDAKGQTYRFKEIGGVTMDFAVTSRTDTEKLSVEWIVERLDYMDQALRMLRTELGDETALIGFSGSPWTLATSMMESASVPKYSRALQLFREDPQTYFLLAEKLTAAIIAYLQMQTAAGVDALQIFDSHGRASGRRQISKSFRALDQPGHRGLRWQSPGHQFFTRYARQPAGSHRQRRQWSRHRLADVVGRSAKNRSGAIAMQGNQAPAHIAESTRKPSRGKQKIFLEAMRGRPGHIFNLGYGLTPAARLENIATVVDAVKSFK
jgi:uroporphyrinogen decarboxylase